MNPGVAQRHTLWENVRLGFGKVDSLEVATRLAHEVSFILLFSITREAYLMQWVTNF